MEKIYVLPDAGNISHLCRVIENAVNARLSLENTCRFSEEKENHKRTMTIVCALGIPIIVTVARVDSNRITVTTTVPFSSNPHALTDPPTPYLGDCSWMTFAEKRASEIVFQDAEKYIASLKNHDPCHD